MALTNYDNKFYGQQEDERILYLVKPHQVSSVFKLGFYLFGGCCCAGCIHCSGKVLGFAGGILTLFGLAISLHIYFLGQKLLTIHTKEI
jgi:hypothetical protein